MARDELRAWYRDWCDQRQGLSERDGSAGNPVHSSEWHHSDDSAVDLMHALAGELFGD